MSIALVAVMVGAAVGAPTRYLTDRWVARHLAPSFPAGTLIVNVVGSAILGAVTAAGLHGHVSSEVLALVGAGFCGGLTTFSSFGWETNELAEEGAVGYAAANVIITLTACLAAAAVTYLAVTNWVS